MFKYYVGSMILALLSLSSIAATSISSSSVLACDLAKIPLLVEVTDGGHPDTQPLLGEGRAWTALVGVVGNDGKGGFQADTYLCVEHVLLSASLNPLPLAWSGRVGAGEPAVVVEDKTLLLAFLNAVHVTGIGIKATACMQLYDFLVP
jgi:hypothetical protein